MGDLCSDCNIFVTHCKTIVDGNGIVRGLPPRSNSPAILKSIGCMHCIRIGIIALIALCIGARFTSASRPSLLKLRSALPATVLKPLWWDVCRMPLEMLGYSFADDYEEMLQMHAEGANAVGMGAMWHPIRAPNEPYGVGALPPYTLLGAERLAQTFRTNVRIKGLAVHTPTWFTNDAAFTLRVYRIGRNGCLMQIAQKRFTNVPDNAWCTIEFAPQPPGRYLWEMVDGKGRIGAWAKWGNVYVYGDAFLGGNRALDIDFETRLVLTNGASAELFVTGDPHVSVPLGWGRINTVEQLGMRTNFSVGNWNNGHFPYYPDWFFKRYPDVAMLDQHGNSFMAGMFGKRYPWVAIDHPVIVSGTQRFIRKTVAMLKNAQCIAYWVMGGESLFPTYSFPGRWSDYQHNALVHFRRWLECKYRTVDALNGAWGTNYRDFNEIQPPHRPNANIQSLEWFRFREYAMAERFQWHYANIRTVDAHRPILTCNHGDIYSGMRRTEMGASPTLYAGVSDGFETGQIIRGDDPTLFNLMYFRSLATFGKPICPARLAYKFPDPLARGGGRSFTPEAVRRYVYECLGMGAWHVGLIQWRGSLPDGEWGIKGTPAQREVQRIFREINSMRAFLDGMWTVQPKVAIYISDSVWLLKGFQMQWLELHRMFTWHHIPAMFVYDWHLVNNGLLGYQIVVSIANDIVPEDALTGLQRFATSGGVVIIDNAFAKYDELLRKRERRSLGKNFLTIDTARYRGDARNSNYSNALFKRIAHSIEERCPQARYLHLNVTSPARPFIKEQFRTLEWAQRNLPEDMSGVRSLGQTVRIPAPLWSVAISTPTYHKRVTDYGFTLRVRLGGPNGAIIATKRIAPPIADNAWHEIRIGREDPANTVYYIEAIPDANLPKQTIGWWGRNEDIYPDGSAFVNGEPVPYDREVVLNVKRYIPTSGALESFVLSDGLNFAVVLINVTEHTVRVRGELNANLLPHSPTRYEWHELITGAKLNDGSQFAIDLGEHATAVVYFKCRTDADEVRELINWLKERIRRLRSDGYLTPVMSALYDRAMEHYLMHRYAKAGALLLRTANQLGIRIENVRRNAVSRGGIRIILSLRSVNEDVIDDARVIAEVVPLFGLTGQFKHIGNGKYELRIPANAMPLRYDYTQQRYVPYDGPIELLIHAFSSRGDGGLRLSW